MVDVLCEILLTFFKIKCAEIIIKMCLKIVESSIFHTNKQNSYELNCKIVIELRISTNKVVIISGKGLTVTMKALKNICT